MPRAGRRRSVVWACFVENAASGKRRVLCRFCDHDLVANPIRMVRHIVKHCPNADEQHKKICREYQSLTVPLRRRGRGDEDDDADNENEVHGETRADADADALPSEVASSVALSFALPHTVTQFALASLPPPNEMGPLEVTQSAEPHDTIHTSSTVSAALDESVVERVHEELALAIATTDGSSMELLDNPRFAKALQLMNVPALTTADVETCVAPRLCKRIATEALAAMQTATTITVQVTSMVVEGSEGVDVFASDQDHRQVPLGGLPAAASTEALAPLVRTRFDQLPRKPSCEVHLCTDTFGVTAQAFSAVGDHTVSHGENSTMPLFVGGCLMQASLLLLAKVVETAPRIRRTVEACVILSERIAVDSSVHSDLQGEFAVSRLNDEDASLWSLLAVVDQIVRHRDALRDAAVGPLLPFVGDDQFWCDTRLTQELLRPFGFLVALSDCGHLNSSMVLVSWLLVWATALHSAVLADDETAAIASTVLAHIQRHGLPLAMVCLALDPRCRGLGLSTLGKRKVRSMMVMTAHKLNPQVNQPALLEHIVKYLNSERPFDDEASWQMMASLPRLFWVEYNAEAHELASVALASLSFRPFIHSLQQTWAIASASSTTTGRTAETAQAHGSQASTLKRLAFQADMIERSTSDHRKQALVLAARLLLTGSTSAAPSVQPRDGNGAETVTCSSYSDELPAESPHAFLDRLDRVGKTLSPANDAIASDNSTMANDAIEATWFSVDVSDAVLQLQSCLHRALFGDYTELHVDSTDHVDAHEEKRDTTSSSDHVTSSSVEETASTMLSGLEEL